MYYKAGTKYREVVYVPIDPSFSISYSSVFLIIIYYNFVLITTTKQLKPEVKRR